MNNQNKIPMPRPNTDLDFQAGLTDPYTSSPHVDPAFSNKFKEFNYILDKDGNPIKDKDGNPQIQITKDLWGILQIFNRDWRLGNIDKREEAVYIRHHIDLSTDILNLLGDEFNQSALICLTRALTVNETSQAKSGFLRRMLNTFIHKTNNSTDNETTKKRSFAQFGKKTY